jgi:antitoxin HicB
MEGAGKGQKGIEYYMHLPYSILLHQVEEEGEKYWMAEVPELPGCRSHGSTVEEAVKNVEEAKNDWILDSLEEGEEVPVPVDRENYSGRFVLRMSRSLHRALSLLAESERLSLNQLVVTILAKEVGRLGVLNRVEHKIDELLNKVNDVLEGEELRTLSQQINVIAGHPEQAQYLMIDTAHTWEAPAAAAKIGAFTSGFVGTSSPLEELWPHLKRAAYQRISFGDSREKEIESRGAVESKQK